MSTMREVRRKPQNNQADSPAGERNDHRGPMSPAGLAGLQQQVGNRAVQRLLALETEAEGIAPAEETEEPANTPEEAGERVKLPSGMAWVGRYPISKLEEDLNSDFDSDVRKFTTLLQKAGARVEFVSTLLPPERAYLMHWAWRIAKEGFDPQAVPDMKDVNIQWWHGDYKASLDAAWEMVHGFKISEQKEPPPLVDDYTEGNVVALRIRWSGKLVLYKDQPNEQIIERGPTDTTNPALIPLADKHHLFYHLTVPDSDEVHWGAKEKKK